MRASLLLLLSVSWLSGCGDNDAGAFADPPVVPDAQNGIPPDGPSLQDRIDTAVVHIHADTCFLQADTSGCQWADYPVAGPGLFDMAVSTNEAILVIDDFEAGAYPQLTRYRNRILGFY